MIFVQISLKKPEISDIDQKIKWNDIKVAWKNFVLGPSKIIQDNYVVEWKWNTIKPLYFGMKCYFANYMLSNFHTIKLRYNNNDNETYKNSFHISDEILLQSDFESYMVGELYYFLTIFMHK